MIKWEAFEEVSDAMHSLAEAFAHLTDALEDRGLVEPIVSEI